MTENRHKIVEEIILVLKDPKNNWSSFYNKYKNDSDVMRLYSTIRKAKEAELRINSESKPNVDLELLKLKNKLKSKKRVLSPWIAAASIAVLITTALIFIVNKDIYTHKKNYIAKGSDNVVLINSKGKAIELKKEKNQIINVKLGVDIVNNKNNIDYSKLKETKNKDLDLEYNTVKIPKYADCKLTLSDGTEVWLNSQTEFKYPISFNNSQRVVELKGEAFFKVAKDKKRPFIVKSRGVKTRVLGTEFNVSAYDSEKVNITLVEGSVKLSDQINSTILKPGENGCVLKDKIEVKNVDVEKYTAWIKGYFYFEKERLEDIMTKLQRWYNFKVFYLNDSTKDFLFKLRAEKKSEFSEIIKRLEYTGKIKVKVEGNSVLISEKK